MKLRRKALGISIKKISLILKWSLLIDCYSQRFPKLRKAFEEAKATGGPGGNDHDNAVQAPPQKTPVKRKADGDGSAKPKSAKKKLNNGNSHPQVAVFKGEEDDENE
jgi:hypothetical protein